MKATSRAGLFPCLEHHLPPPIVQGRMIAEEQTWQKTVEFGWSRADSREMGKKSRELAGFLGLISAQSLLLPLKGTLMPAC